MLVDVVCPEGVAEGDLISIQHPETTQCYDVAIPAGVGPGVSFQVELPDVQQQVAIALPPEPLERRLPSIGPAVAVVAPLDVPASSRVAAAGGANSAVALRLPAAPMLRDTAFGGSLSGSFIRIGALPRPARTLLQISSSIFQTPRKPLCASGLGSRQTAPITLHTGPSAHGSEGVPAQPPSMRAPSSSALLIARCTGRASLMALVGIPHGSGPCSPCGTRCR